MNIEEITHYIVRNYNENVDKFIQLLNEIDCELIYNGKGLTDCIENRLVYACSIQFMKKNRLKVLNCILPIMIGSKLDVAARKLKWTRFEKLDSVPNLAEGQFDFEPGDIGMCCFVINGALKQIPFFISNDVTNPHIVKGTFVRIYRYDSNEKGQELSLYFGDVGEFKRGDLIMKLNDGTHSENTDNFFDCPYPVDSRTYLTRIYNNSFDIDRLDNRVITSPGHLFYKLFTKNLYMPLKMRNNGNVKIYDEIAKKHLLVVKSITNGDVLHIISKKTLFFKENNVKNKMVNVQGNTPQREIGNNNEVYIEKKSTPYREANCQYYPYFPYLAHFTNLQISNKVKSKKVLAFLNSYIGFLCLYGTSEAKNVGRVMMMTRDTFVSTQDDVNRVYECLNIESGEDGYFIVINAACTPITLRCFKSIALRQLKERLTFVECYVSEKFIFINYKTGLLYKKLENNFWVTSRDIHYWVDCFEDFINSRGVGFITSYSADIIKYAKHNGFPKNILALNALKNSVLSITPEYSIYFRETVSAYMIKTELHQPVLEPQNKFSVPFTLYLPKINVMFASFKGCTQEDCIVMKEDLNVFDIYRIYTIKIKFSNSVAKYFYPRIGPPQPNKNTSFLGTIACPTEKIVILSQTMHLILEEKGEKAINIYMKKPDLSVIDFKTVSDYLLITIQSLHQCSTGDKLCSLHGQKGVLQKHKQLPYAMYQGKKIEPHIIINALCIISRQTMGQILEVIDNGGRDYTEVYNSDGKKMPNTVSLIGPVNYAGILYLSQEHKYVATKCKRDKAHGQPVRGRSREGGMRVGNMEVFNGLRGNGIAATCEEVFFENSDRFIHNGIPVPQSMVLCNEDANFFKTNIHYKVLEPVIEE